MTFNAVGPARHRTFPSASWRTGLRRRLSAGGLACAAALVAAGATAVPAEAAPAATTAYFWVAPTSTSTLNTSCSTAGYHTVQSAVVAAEAYESAHPTVVPTIEICPATYSEQVTVTSSLIMTRAKGSQGPTVIQLPAAVGQNTSLGLSTTNCQAKDATSHPATQVPQSVIEVCAAKAGGVNAGGVSVSISHITIEGQWASAVCYDSLNGLLVEGGASVSLSESIVQKIGGDATTDGCQGGVDVQAGDSVTGQIGHVTLTNDTIESYQKNGITVDGPGSTGKVSGVTVTGAGPTGAIAQNGIQISLGATGTVSHSTVTGNNYTGPAFATAAGILVFGGGGSVCGNGKISPLVKRASFAHNTLINNDIGVALFNVDSTCSKSPRTPTRDTVCYNVISNSHGYSNGEPSADANVAGFQTGKGKLIGDQAGVSDSGNADVICSNSISGSGYRQRDKTSTLPNPAPPAWVRPIDLFSYAPAIHPSVHGNSYDGKPYKPN
jgi:hypothetical protein